MSRFHELLEKRKNKTANIFEENELLEIAETMNEEELKDIDKSLLSFTNKERMDNIISILDKIISTGDELLNQLK